MLHLHNQHEIPQMGAIPAYATQAVPQNFFPQPVAYGGVAPTPQNMPPTAVGYGGTANAYPVAPAGGMSGYPQCGYQNANGQQPAPALPYGAAPQGYPAPQPGYPQQPPQQ
ncbi:hypothetical protein KIPB_014666, partial [Kipferlia bialata]|eukprot:g14666.t1